MIESQSIQIKECVYTKAEPFIAFELFQLLIINRNYIIIMLLRTRVKLHSVLKVTFQNFKVISSKIQAQSRSFPLIRTH